MREGVEIAGRYRLEELHGRGPMSEVWRAHDEVLDRTVALKLLGPTADLERFRREARAVASLGHENVMRVYDYGEDAAGPYMALEWLPGGTLEDRLGDGPLPADETGRIARGIAAGLAHMHARGFLHRDLKPANVLFDDEERPKLADFGLARSASPAGTLTEAGTVLGTAAYISPEQAAGEPATPASDIYSFGVVLFRMLTGGLPFVANDALVLLDLHRTEPALPVAELNPGAPPELAALTDAALQKDPAARPPDGAAALAALGGAPVAVSFVGAADETMVVEDAALPPPKPRHLLSLVVGLFLLASLGGLLAWGITRPPAAPKAGVTTSGVAGAQKSKGSRVRPTTGARTASTAARSTSTRTATHPTTTRRRTTTARTHTAPLAGVTTTPPTTATQPATTAPATTQSTTTTATTTTTTTSTTTTTPTTTG